MADPTLAVPEFDDAEWATRFRNDLWNKRDNRYVEVRKDAEEQEYKILRHKMDWSTKIQHPVLVLGEWERIYEYIDSDEFREEARELGAGLCVGGQSGVGKSTLLRYLLARALNGGVPVLFINDLDPGWLLFNAKGVTEIPAKDQTVSAMAKHCDKGSLLGLVDVDLKKEDDFPYVLVGLRLRIVQAASPRKMDLAERWMKHRESAMVWLVDPWSEREVSLVAKSVSSPEDCASVVGPIPRYIFAKGRDADAYRKQLARIVDSFFVILSHGLSLVTIYQPEAYHQLFMVHRWPNKSQPMMPPTSLLVLFVSPFVEKLFLSELVKRELDDMLQFLPRLATLPQVAALVFEAAAVKLFAKPTGVFKGFLDLTVVKSSIVTRTPFTYPLVQLPESRPLEFDPITSASPPNKHQLYVPPAGFATLDAFVWNDDGLFIFQMTIAKPHSLKADNLDKLLDALPSHVKNLERHLIFVVPSYRRTRPASFSPNRHSEARR
ncbi:hypothetical protein MNV49_005425 [Pseudohyphozyma bogoriensis]|nr:hypothetical protein MNV49_005425 [Pseudohyphozyma bogoriensis]